MWGPRLPQLLNGNPTLSYPTTIQNGTANINLSYSFLIVIVKTTYSIENSQHVIIENIGGLELIHRFSSPNSWVEMLPVFLLSTGSCKQRGPYKPTQYERPLVLWIGDWTGDVTHHSYQTCQKEVHILSERERERACKKEVHIQREREPWLGHSTSRSELLKANQDGRPQAFSVGRILETYKGSKKKWQGNNKEKPLHESLMEIQDTNQLNMFGVATDGSMPRWTSSYKVASK